MFPFFQHPPHLPLVFTSKDHALLTSLRIRPDADIASNPRDSLQPVRQAREDLISAMRKENDPDILAEHPFKALDAFEKAPIRARSFARMRADAARGRHESCRCGVDVPPHPACYL